MRSFDVQKVATGVCSHSRLGIARALRAVDDDQAFAQKLGVALANHIRGIPVIGITGNPGAGKSTLVDQLLCHYRGQHKRVGVLAIDPSSPFSGGAILGDRIRMAQHHADDGVFIRSFATRGNLGGLSRSAFDSVRIFDAAGFDVVLVETVGVGQDEVDIARLAHTTLVVLVPGLGDDIQAMKAGLLEVADIFAINKADHQGADELEKALRYMMALGAPSHWEVPIVKTVATKGMGIDELMEHIAAHGNVMAQQGASKEQAIRRVALFECLLEGAIVGHVKKNISAHLDPVRLQVEQGSLDIYAAVEQLIKKIPC